MRPGMSSDKECRQFVVEPSVQEIRATDIERGILHGHPALMFISGANSRSANMITSGSYSCLCLFEVAPLSASSRAEE